MAKKPKTQNDVIPVSKEMIAMDNLDDPSMKAARAESDRIAFEALKRMERDRVLNPTKRKLT